MVLRWGLARMMIGRVRELGLPFAWFTADEAYGDNGKLREWLEKAGIAYVVAVSCDHRAPAGAEKTIRADLLAAKVPGRGWQRAGEMGVLAPGSSEVADRIARVRGDFVGEGRIGEGQNGPAGGGEHVPEAAGRRPEEAWWSVGPGG
jgi:DDE superfamily endonuclease